MGNEAGKNSETQMHTRSWQTILLHMSTRKPSAGTSVGAGWGWGGWEAWAHEAALKVCVTE